MPNQRILDKLNPSKTAEKLKIKEAKEKKSAQIKKDINHIFATIEGKNVLRYLSEICGHNKCSMVRRGDTGEIDKDLTVYNEARRLVYLDLRRYVDDDILKEVEFDAGNRD